MIASVRDPAFSCDYSVFVLRGSGEPAPAGPVEPPNSLDEERHGPDGLRGSFVVAGTGWAQVCSTSDVEHDVLLEAHDAEPPVDLDAWADVAETPFWAARDGLELATLLGEGEADLPLDGGTLYRLRVARRPRTTPLAADDDGVLPDEVSGPRPGDDVLVQLWPQPVPGIPRRLAGEPPRRRHPVVEWRDVLGPELDQLAFTVAQAAATLGRDAVSAEDLDRWAASMGWPAGWLDRSPADGLDGGYRPPGAPTLDRVASLLSAHGSVDTRRAALDALAGCGLLTRTAAGYRYAGSPPFPDQVLAMPADLLAALAAGADGELLAPLVVDIVFAELWRRAAGPDAPPLTLAGLAAALAVPTGFAVQALRYGVEQGRLAVDPAPADLDPQSPDRPVSVQPLWPDDAVHRPFAMDLEEVRYTFAPAAPPPDPVARLKARMAANQDRPGPAPQPVPAPSAPGPMPPPMPMSRPVPLPESVVTAQGAYAVARSWQPEPSPTGPPPRAGWVTGAGTAIVPRDGGWVELATAGSGPLLETAFGVVAVQDDVTLVAWDGTVRTAGLSGVLHAAIDAGGTWLVAYSWRHRTDRHQVRLVDLPGMSVTGLPADERRPVSVVGVAGGRVYLASGGDDPIVPGPGMTWIPGSDPVVDPELAGLLDVDPVSGATLCLRDGGTLLVRHPELGEATLAAPPVAQPHRDQFGGVAHPGSAAFQVGHRLAPGGRRLVRCADGRVRVHPLFGGPELTWPLPGSETPVPGWNRMLWDDPDHLLLISYGPGRIQHLRLDLRDGTVDEPGSPTPPPGGQLPGGQLPGGQGWISGLRWPVVPLLARPSR